jgi:hypothetical protein
MNNYTIFGELVAVASNILEGYEKYHPVYKKSYKNCQVNKRQTRKYGLSQHKTMMSTSWGAYLVGLYTLKGKDDSTIDFMALTMIEPASSWFETVELP